MTFWNSGVMSPWHSTVTAPGRLIANIETSVSTPTESSLAWSASPTPATLGVHAHTKAGYVGSAQVRMQPLCACARVHMCECMGMGMGVCTCMGVCMCRCVCMCVAMRCAGCLEAVAP